jgi:hypothetical protein
MRQRLLLETPTLVVPAMLGRPQPANGNCANKGLIFNAPYPNKNNGIDHLPE